MNKSGSWGTNVVVNTKVNRQQRVTGAEDTRAEGGESLSGEWQFEL